MIRERQANPGPVGGLIATLVVLLLCAGWHDQDQRSLRLALVEFVGDETRAITKAVGELASAQGLNRPVELLDEQQVASAVRGSGYSGSLNLSLREARDLGMSIGCEYYLLGNVVLGRRVGPLGTDAGSGASYYIGVIGIFLVEARTGRLASFACQQVDGSSEDEARKRLIASLGAAWGEIRKRLVANRSTGAPAPPVGLDNDVIIDIDDPAGSAGVASPVFYERVKPQYTNEAQVGRVTATVEVQAVFRSSGKVTDLEIVRWAGFGLDESAMDTAARLRFKPAERNGQPISVRALLRYNFKG